MDRNVISYSQVLQDLSLISFVKDASFRDVKLSHATPALVYQMKLNQ